jgi:DNA-directed RNA polymerase subunit alpha
MPEIQIMLPSKPRIISEEENKGTYEIEGLYPGYGHTLGNSLRRIILSSLPGAAVTSVKIDGANHEFSTLPGVKEDVIRIILNMKKVRFKMSTEETQEVKLLVKGIKNVTAKDLILPGQVEVTNPDEVIATLTEKDATLDMVVTVERGLGYVPREVLNKEKVDVGTIAVDGVFTPVRRVNYEVENMRVGNRTDFNKLRIFIETDGIISPREALEKSIEIMIRQLKAIVGWKEEEPSDFYSKDATATEMAELEAEAKPKNQEDILKTRIEDLNLSVRTSKALSVSSIRTIGGLARKSEEDLLDTPGLGEKGLQEIKRVLSNFGITLRT